MRRRTYFLVIIGIVLLSIGFFMTSSNNNKIISCSSHNDNSNLDSTYSYKIDNSGKVIYYEFVLKTSYSEKSDEEFKEICSDLDSISSTKDVIIENRHCDFDKKILYTSFKYMYDEIKNSIYYDLLSRHFEYVDQDGILDIEKWTKEFKSKGYVCE